MSTHNICKKHLLWVQVLIRMAITRIHVYNSQHMFLWRNTQNYHLIIIKYPPYLLIQHMPQRGDSNDYP